MQTYKQICYIIANFNQAIKAKNEKFYIFRRGFDFI